MSTDWYEKKKDDEEKNVIHTKFGYIFIFCI